MTYLADTNVLLRFAHRSDPLHLVVRNAVRKLRSGGDLVRASSQNLIEFWNVTTRPIANNGFGFTPNKARRPLAIVERLLGMVADSNALYAQWRQLVMNFSVSGVQVHDARLVAVMMVNQLTHILTFNASDFGRYSVLGIVAVDPHTV